MGIALLEPRQHAQSPEIGTKVKKVSGRDLTGHNAISYATVGEGFDHLRELADFDPDQFVHQISQRAVRLTLEPNRNQAFDTLGAGLAGELERQSPVAGNDADAIEGRSHKRPFGRQSRLALMHICLI